MLDDDAPEQQSFWTPKNLIRICYIAFGVIFALCLSSMVVGSGGREGLDITPGANLSAYVVLIAIALALSTLIALTVFLKGKGKGSGKVVVGSLALCGVLIILSYAVAFAALSRSSYSFSRDAYLEEQWQMFKDSERASIEREFGCCGFNSQADFYGLGWNSSCPKGELNRNTCCKGIKQWDHLMKNVSINNGACESTQLRYQCCVPETTVWPCYRLPACHSVVLEWFQHQFKFIAIYILVTSTLQACMLATIVLTSVLLDSQDENEI